MTALLVIVIFVYTAYAAPISIDPAGETILVARSARFDVRVSIKTRQLEKKVKTLGDRGNEHEAFPYRNTVDRIDITVGDRQLIVPHSVFCDLRDLNRAEIRLGSKTAILVIDGGDASDAYWVKVEFDTTQVRRRTLGSGLLAGKISQDTIYRVHILKDQ